MKPKGHKRGCRCVVCSHGKKPVKKKATKRRRNHGMESQMRALVRSAPKKRKNSTIRMSRNPDDLGCMSNPAGKQWFMLDMFDRKGPISTSIEQTTPASARDGANNQLGRVIAGKRVHSAQLSGPYRTRPTASTVRK